MTKHCRRLVASVFLLALLFALGSGPALAHAVLTDSMPKPDGTIAPGHQRLRFDYNSRIDHRRSRLTLTTPDGRQQVLAILADSAANALDAEADLTAGAYSLRWQALALDGHITRGDVRFSVTPAASGSARASASR